MSKFSNETYFEFSNEFVGHTVVTNFILNDRRLSFKAQGIYLQILQFQNNPDHKVYLKGLAKMKKDGEDSVASGINELIKFGYIQRIPMRNEKGQMQGYKYIMYQKPLEPQEVEPKGENPVPVNPNWEEQGQTNKIGNKENTKDKDIVNKEEKVNNLNDEYITKLFNDHLTKGINKKLFLRIIEEFNENKKTTKIDNERAYFRGMLNNVLNHKDFKLNGAKRKSPIASGYNWLAS
jgi:hypothetical protein